MRHKIFAYKKFKIFEIFLTFRKKNLDFKITNSYILLSHKNAIKRRNVRFLGQILKKHILAYLKTEKSISRSEKPGRPESLFCFTTKIKKHHPKILESSKFKPEALKMNQAELKLVVSGLRVKTGKWRNIRNPEGYKGRLELLRGNVANLVSELY